MSRGHPSTGRAESIAGYRIAAHNARSARILLPTGNLRRRALGAKRDLDGVRRPVRGRGRPSGRANGRCVSHVGGL